MPRQLILHIGLTKTGSTSIQNVLAGHRGPMLAQGVLYPTSPGDVNQAYLPAAAVNEPKKLRGLHPSIWEGLTPASRIAAFRREFTAEMEGMKPAIRTVIISAEQCAGMLREEAEVRNVREMVKAYFDSYKIVVYLRRQDLHVVSNYSQFLRMGMLREPGLPAGGPDELFQYDYAALLGRWEKVFGKGTVVPRVFERKLMVNGDAVDDFLSIAGVDLHVPADHRTRASNQSMNLAGQGLLLAAGKVLGTQSSRKWMDRPTLWPRYAKAVTDVLPGRGWRPSRDEVSDFMSRFAATNEAVRKGWFPEHETLFSLDYTDLPETPELPPEDSVGAAIQVLMHQLEAGARAEAIAALALARLHGKLEDKQAMRAALQRAVKIDPELLPARLELAAMFKAEGNARQARLHAEAALAVAPNNPAAKRLVEELRPEDGGGDVFAQNAKRGPKAAKLKSAAA